jgi:GcrA cell cycle regulator
MPIIARIDTIRTPVKIEKPLLSTGFFFFHRFNDCVCRAVLHTVSCGDSQKRSLDMVWDEETISHLRDLWAQGLSTAEIGRRLGVSKNAIVGKAHRLDLSARPSPIRRDGSRPAGTRAPAQPRASSSTLPPLNSATTPLVQTLRIVTATPRPTEMIRPVPAPAPVRPVMSTPSLQPRRSGVSCCWPIGEPGTKSFRFCDDTSLPGKPYCAEHAKLAYVRVRDRKEDAA